MAVVIGHVAFCGLHSTALAHEARTLHFVVAVMWPVFHERASVKSALVQHHHHAFLMIRTKPVKDTGFFFHRDPPPPASLRRARGPMQTQTFRFPVLSCAGHSSTGSRAYPGWEQIALLSADASVLAEQACWHMSDVRLLPFFDTIF